MPTGDRSDEASSRQSRQLRVEFHPAASAELIEAGRFYEGRSPGLGYAFLDAVDEALGVLRQNPMLGRGGQRGQRRWRIPRFPYLLIYRIEGASLDILAIAHTSRKPRYWKERDCSKE